jgi:hypothetical protein
MTPLRQVSEGEQFHSLLASMGLEHVAPLAKLRPVGRQASP